MPNTTLEVLAPAGDASSFLAALAAGADAVYAATKHFSARMQAANFSVSELARLGRLAHDKGARLYVTFNALMKPGDLAPAGRLMQRVARTVKPDGFIVQDPAALDLARQAGFTGELHLSTLANLSHPAGLAEAARLGAGRVVVPRELDLDEIKDMARACPDDLSLEVFVHGALCYGVSGRCYWSSWLGGKSGLRGRCVQPCRRLYRQPGGKGKPARLFSCQDLSLDVLVRTLADTPKITALKIEGRKKGPHYVYHTVKAYKMLLHQGNDPQARKLAQEMLERALGRPATHGGFLPQRPFPVVALDAESASGLPVGTVKHGQGNKAFFIAREKLLPGDLVRIGYEDDPWHATVRVMRGLPKRGRFDLKPTGKPPSSGATVFLVDRREPQLAALVRQLEGELAALAKPESGQSSFSPSLPRSAKTRGRPREVDVFRMPPRDGVPGLAGLWLSPKAVAAAGGGHLRSAWWWLPPVIWPKEEKGLKAALETVAAKGGKTFVLGAPWQAGLFRDLGKVELIAGPFCNLANPLAVQAVAELGCAAAFVSPELPGEDLLALPKICPLPLGIVVKGLWPVCVSRHLAKGLKTEQAVASPMGEAFWTRRIGPTVYVYPNWRLDLSAKRDDLARAGYAYFAQLHESQPKAVPKADRPGMFNYDIKLL